MNDLIILFPFVPQFRIHPSSGSMARMVTEVTGPTPGTLLSMFIFLFPNRTLMNEFSNFIVQLS